MAEECLACGRHGARGRLKEGVDFLFAHNIKLWLVAGILLSKFWH